MFTKLFPPQRAKSLILVFLVPFIYLPLLAQIPSTYYDQANGKTGTQLKEALNNIISGHTTFPYSSAGTDTWDILQEADRDPDNTNRVVGIYSGFSMDAAAEFNNGNGWNREHVWAKSRGDFGTSEGPGTDCHHLRAADISTNAARGNKGFGYGDTFYIDTQGVYSGSTLSRTSSVDEVWEPRDEVKGDVARMMFYMATRYEGENGEPDLELTETVLGSSDKSPFHASLSILLEWHQQDPVSQAERERNEVIYSYQNNRNPFIDHPEYVCEIYSCDSPGGNNAPYFTSSPSTTAIAGSTYSYTIATRDLDGDNMTISALSLPDWINLTDNGNGTALLTGSTLNTGTYAVSLVVSDADASNTQNFDVVVRSDGGSTADTDELFFSEYIEGSSFNKGVEIANFTGSSINLARYSIRKQVNGAGPWTGNLVLTGTLTDGDVYVVINTSASLSMQSVAELSTASDVVAFNGNDPLGLFKDGQLIDVIGNFNSSISFAANTTLVRKETINSPSTIYSTDEWESYPSNTFSFLGSHRMASGGVDDIQSPSIPENIQISNISQSSFDISWEASTDNISVSEYLIYVNETMYANTSSTAATIEGLSASTTYILHVSARDEAGNESELSEAIEVSTDRVGTSPDCNHLIASFPYQESFEESTLWRQSSDDDFDWLITSGETPSSNTGPSSAFDGSRYFYIESSSPNYPSKTASLLSPCFELKDADQANLIFFYHMYGPGHTGSLQLEVTEDGQNWVSIWSRSGNQGAQWKSAQLDLAAYIGTSIQLRFVAQTGDSWQGDTALDDIRFFTSTQPVEKNVNLSLTFDNYPEETAWEIVDGATVVAQGGPYENYEEGSTVNIPIRLIEGCYDFIIYDAYGDGMCCSYGRGSYTLSENESLLVSGGSFGNGESSRFCLGASSRSMVQTTALPPKPRRIEELRISPNPVVSSFKISLGKMEAADYEILTPSGDLVQKGHVDGKSSLIEVNSLASGIYLLRISDANQVLTRKILIQR